MDDHPVVSIIIATLNGEKYLADALSSVFKQSYGNYELIVVDDGSVSDAVKNICSQYGGKLTYIRQNNQGQPAAVNHGIRMSRGKYLAFLDDDDVWMPDKLEKQMRFIQDLESKGSRVGVVYTGHEYVDESGRHLGNILYKSSGVNYRKLIFIDFIGTPSSALIPRSVLDDIGLFDVAMTNAHDHDLWVRIGRKYGVYSLNEILIKYRNRPGSLSKNVPLKVKNTSQILKKIIDDFRANNEIDVQLEKKLTKRFQSIAAQRWKNAAYEFLFYEKDAATFRKYIREGYALDKSLFGTKAGIYYLLSFVSVSLCRKIKGLKKSGPTDTIVDVAGLNFE